MKKKKIFGWAEQLTIAFYLGLFLIPILIYNGFNMSYSFPQIFKIPPTNYLLYLTPIVFYLFLKKKKNIRKNETVYTNLFVNVLLLFFIYIEFHTTAGNPLTYTTIAILVLSVIFININDFTASLTLLPGLFITKLGILYIFAAYIPVLFLMMIKNGDFRAESNSTTEKKPSYLQLFAYLYTSVLAAILLYKRKLPLNIATITPSLFLANDYVNLVAGIILLLASCVLFVIRAVPVIRKGSITEKISIIFAAIYPLFFAALGAFYSLISYNFQSGFTIALLMYVMNNVQLGITYKDKVGDIVPNRLKNTTSIIIASVIFCSFCFNKA